jgi:hypothetical protein
LGLAGEGCGVPVLIDAHRCTQAGCGAARGAPATRFTSALAISIWAWSAAALIRQPPGGGNWPRRASRLARFARHRAWGIAAELVHVFLIVAGVAVGAGAAVVVGLLS